MDRHFCTQLTRPSCKKLWLYRLYETSPNLSTWENSGGKGSPVTKVTYLITNRKPVRPHKIWFRRIHSIVWKQHTEPEQMPHQAQLSQWCRVDHRLESPMHNLLQPMHIYLPQPLHSIFMNLHDHLSEDRKFNSTERALHQFNTTTSNVLKCKLPNSTDVLPAILIHRIQELQFNIFP